MDTGSGTCDRPNVRPASLLWGGPATPPLFPPLPPPALSPARAEAPLPSPGPRKRYQESTGYGSLSTDNLGGPRTAGKGWGCERGEALSGLQAPSAPRFLCPQYSPKSILFFAGTTELSEEQMKPSQRVTGGRGGGCEGQEGRERGRDSCSCLESSGYQVLSPPARGELPSPWFLPSLPEVERTRHFLPWGQSRGQIRRLGMGRVSGAPTAPTPRESLPSASYTEANR